MGSTLRGDWGHVLRCSMGSCIVVWVRLGDWVGIGVGTPVAETFRLVVG